jgi:hypothetical protein
MTQDELDALPEDGLFGEREEIRDGKIVRIPVLETVGALYQGENDIMLIEDRHGRFWTTGWAGGVLYKRRMR